ncbi:MAG TPA: hypothetical protein VI818_04320 [Candidatus Thermoplasmatota archaeon]|nr:hypothetical protein [Candidatus Thermoplasmatota archaeon]
MAYQPPNAGIEEAVCLGKHHRRKSRGRFRKATIYHYALYTRSIEGQGSIQAAQVAAQRLAPPADPLAALVRSSAAGNGAAPHAQPPPPSNGGLLGRFRPGGGGA